MTLFLIGSPLCESSRTPFYLIRNNKQARWSVGQNAYKPMTAATKLELKSGWPPSTGCLDPPKRSGCSRCGSRALAVCGSLAGTDLQRMNDLAEVVTLKSGAVLVREGEPAPYVFNITS